MIEDEPDHAGWSADAVKDWGVAFLLNMLFPIGILFGASWSGRYENGAEWYWMGALAAGAMILAVGVYFAGRESMIFTRVIDGAYILAIAQLFPLTQFAALTGGVAVWKILSSGLRVRGGELPVLESYSVFLGFGQFSLLASFFLGCVYRKPRRYPRWLRPWNHEFDRDNDTLTRR